jgi:predicted ester cyclase
MGVDLIWKHALIPFALGSTVAGMTAGPGEASAHTSVAMTRFRTSEVVREYITALLAKGPATEYFADDIVMTVVDLDQQIVGKEAVAQMVTNFHEVAFTTALEVRQFLAGTGIAYAEILFVGTHTGDFAGIPATGREVRVPYVAVTELSDDFITAIRLYGPASGIIRQLATPATQAS